MIKFNSRLYFVLALISSVACSSPVDEAFDMAQALEDGAALDEDGEFAQLEQPVVALNSTTRQWGTQTGSDRRSCDKTSGGQVCTLAKFKKIELARTPGSWTSAQDSQLSTVAFKLNSAYAPSGWNFTFVNSSSTPAADAVRLLISKSTSGGGNNGNSIKNYRTIDFHSPVAMTEGQQSGLGTPVGQYQHHGSCSTTVFQTRIETKTATANEELRMLDHAVGNAAVACMGVGTRADAPSSYSQEPIFLTGFVSAARPGEVCRANIGDMSDLADFSVQTASVCAD